MLTSEIGGCAGKKNEAEIVGGKTDVTHLPICHDELVLLIEEDVVVPEITVNDSSHLGCVTLVHFVEFLRIGHSLGEKFTEAFLAWY